MLAERLVHIDLTTPVNYGATLGYAAAGEAASERAALLECIMEELLRLVRERQTDGVAWSVCQDLLTHLAGGPQSVSQTVQ